MGQLTRWINHVGNHRTCFGFGVLLIVAHLVTTAERVYRYRHAGPWIVIARAAGQCLHLDCALVVLLTLRRSISWLRSRGLDWLLPLDRHVYFHKIIGWSVCFFSLVHTIAHVSNYAVQSRANGDPLSGYLFNPTAGWIPGVVTPSGLALLFILLVMGLFSHRYVRKSGRFELFYWTHLLCVPFYVLMILHAGNVWKWLALPTCLFAVELFYRMWFICSDRGKARVSSLLLLPNQVVRLKIERPPDFEFQAGDYVYVNIPQVARFEWHPFTISSAPEDEDYMTIHVRVAGGWTSKLHSICQEDAERLNRQKSIQQLALVSKLMPFQSMPLQLENRVPSDGQDNLAYQPEYASLPVTSIEVAVGVGTPFHAARDDANELSPLEMPIMLDGPYGGSSARAWKCRHALLIAGGIGVTPFASLLQSLVSRYQSSMSPCPHCFKACCTNLPASMGKLRHVDFMWVNRDLLSFQWFLELLLDLDREQAVRGSAMEKFLDIQLYQTGSKTVPDSHKPCRACSESLPGIPKADGDPLDIGAAVPIETSSLPIGGRCSYCTFRQMKHLLRYGRPVWDEVFQEVAVRSGGRVAVFYCGPPAMGRVIMAQCRRFGFTFTKEIS